jgi:fatty-acyl-CoA synthase
MAQLSENWATLWEALAAAQPDHVAVVVGDRQLRWRDLEHRSARLAGAFGEHGIGAGSKVAQLL